MSEPTADEARPSSEHVAAGGRPARSAESPDVVVVRCSRQGVDVAVRRAATSPASPAVAAALRREASLHAGALHAHVLPLLHVDDPGGADPELVLPWVAGGSLAERLAHGPLSEGEVAALCASLAGALGAVARSGSVHGDVSPANVLLAPDGHPFLSDFGSARELGDTDPGRRATPGFVAPEVVASEGVLPASTALDAWSLGALGLAALGEPVGHVADDLRPAGAGRASVGLRELLHELCAADPARRPVDLDLVADRLRALPLRDVRWPRPVEGPPAAPRPRPPRTREHGPRPPGGCGAPPGPRTRGGGWPTVWLAAAGALALVLAVATRPVGRVTARPPDGRRGAVHCLDARATAGALLADVWGTGCAQAVTWEAPVLAVAEAGRPPIRYRLGAPGDEVVLGRLGCGRRVLLVRYRPSTGELVRYPPIDHGLAVGRPVGPVASEHLPAGGHLRVAVGGDGCERAVVEG